MRCCGPVGITRRPSDARAFPGAHVGVNELYLAFPHGHIVTLQQDEGVGVLFESPYVDWDACILTGLNGACNEGSATCAHDGDDDLT